MDNLRPTSGGLDLRGWFQMLRGWFQMMQKKKKKKRQEVACSKDCQSTALPGQPGLIAPRRHVLVHVLPVSMSATQHRVAIQTPTPGDRQFGEANGQSSTRHPPSKSSRRRTVPPDTGSSTSYSRSTSQSRGGNESDDDLASVTSATSIPEQAPPSVEEARMTKKQKDKLLKNHLVKSKPKVVAAVEQVAVAQVAMDGASAVGEV